MRAVSQLAISELLDSIGNRNQITSVLFHATFCLASYWQLSALNKRVENPRPIPAPIKSYL